MSTLKGNAVIGQSGGPTAVINQSLVGVIQESRRHGHIDQLLGSRHGVRGVINNDFISLKSVPDDLLERIALTPAAALGSTRDKPDTAYCEKIFEAFRKNNIRYFFYIGGNDSAETARIVNELARGAGYELRTFHIPKTIDNDLRVHDHTPGYASAAKFVASAVIGDDYDNKSLGGIKVDVIMGRHAGFLTAASVLARKYPNDGPHLIYVPESPITEERFLADVDAVYSRIGRCLIAVSEGLSLPEKNEKGEHITWFEKMGQELEKMSHSVEQDQFGNIRLSGSGALGDYLTRLITKSLIKPSGKKIRVRADTFGYAQRSFPGCISEIDAREARQVGQMAVRYSADDANHEGSVAMKRTSNSPYTIEIHLTPLSTVARIPRHMSPEYIQNGNDITPAFIEYVRPLVGNLPVVGSFQELKEL